MCLLFYILTIGDFGACYFWDGVCLTVWLVLIGYLCLFDLCLWLLSCLLWFTVGNWFDSRVCCSCFWFVVLFSSLLGCLYVFTLVIVLFTCAILGFTFPVCLVVGLLLYVVLSYYCFTVFCFCLECSRCWFDLLFPMLRFGFWLCSLGYLWTYLVCACYLRYFVCLLFWLLLFILRVYFVMLIGLTAVFAYFDLIADEFLVL